MPITSHEPQPTGVAAAPLGEPLTRGAAPRTVGLTTHDDRPDGPVDRVGIVFVHGIGTQRAGETFLDWSRPIIELLGEWLQSRHRDAKPVDPVIRSRFSFHPATPPILELGIPPANGRKEARWLITEAWWAADLRAPSFDEATGFLRKRLRAIVRDIRRGYDELLKRRKQRRTPTSPAERRSARDRDDAPARVMATDEAPARWGWVDGLDALQAKVFGLAALAIPVAAIGVAALAVYSLLRRVPLGPVQRFAEFRILDNFLVEWFGDLSILLGDAAQAANVRARVIDAIDRVTSEGAEAVVLVAHSGGAIVSFETLADPAYLDRPVAKLITIGEGLKLAWSLADERQDEHLAGRARLAGDLRARPRLRWVDVWASYDPAPAGGLPARAHLRTADPDQVERVRKEHRGDTVVEDRPVTNRMNVARDHGAYWENAEGFLVPLVRHLDDALGDGGRSRFYERQEDRWARIERRRQRVGVLAGWDWLGSLTGAFSALILIAADNIPVVGQVLPGQAGRLAAAGDGIAQLIAALPGGRILGAPFEAYGQLVGVLVRAATDALGGPAMTNAAVAVLDYLGRGGAGALGLGLVAVLFVALVSLGNGRWERWDRDERRRLLADPARDVDRRQPAAEWALLVGGLAALWCAIVIGNALVVAVFVALGLVASLAIRTRRLRPRASRTS